MKNIFYLIFAVMFFFSNFAHAEIKNYEGEGFFAVENENLDYSKNEAKKDAVRNIAEQIFVDVQSQTEVENSKIIHDEIILKTESLMKILDVKYHLEPGDENSFVIRAIVTAEVDTEEIEKILTERTE